MTKKDCRFLPNNISSLLIGVLLSPGGGSTGTTLEELLPLMERLYALQGFGTKEDLMQWSFTFKGSFQVKSYCNARILGIS